MEAGAPALSPRLAPLERAAFWHRLQAWPWARPILRAAWAVLLITGLAWMGARSAPSASAQPEADEKTAAMLAVLSSASPQAEASSGAAERDAGTGADAGAKGSKRGVLEDGRVVLNEATQQELCQLPGIGPSRASQILALRDRLRGFRSIRQLLRVRGIGPRTLRKLEPRIVLDAPHEAAEEKGREVEEKR